MLSRRLRSSPVARAASLGALIAIAGGAARLLDDTQHDAGGARGTEEAARAAAAAGEMHALRGRVRGKGPGGNGTLPAHPRRPGAAEDRRRLEPVAGELGLHDRSGRERRRERARPRDARRAESNGHRRQPRATFSERISPAPGVAPAAGGRGLGTDRRLSDREPDPGFPRHRREVARPQSSRQHQRCLRPFPGLRQRDRPTGTRRGGPARQPVRTDRA